MSTGNWLLTLFLVTTIAAPAGGAELRSRNEIGLGITDNANLEKEGRDGDLFLKLGTANTIDEGEHLLGVRLNYVDYFKENENDVFSFRLSDAFKIKGSQWKFTGALVGQLYPAGSPASTDFAFNNVGLDASLERSRTAGPKTELAYGGGYRMRYFTSFDGRNDHTAYGAVSADHEATGRLVLSGFGEIGLLISSLPDYSKSYFELGGGIDYDFGSGWRWTTDLAIRQSYFINRSVSKETIVSIRRGVVVSGTRTENETYSHFALTTEAVHEYSDLLRFGIGLSNSVQGSNSGYQDYSALEILGRMILIF